MISGASTVPLMRVMKLKSGDFIAAAEIGTEGAYPVYGGNGLRGYTERWNTEGPIALVGRQGAHCGNVHIAPTKCWVSEHALRCFPEKVYSVNFIRFALESLSLNQHSMSAAQPGLSIDNLKSLPVPFPPLEAQRRIAAFLDEKTAQIDGLIERKRELLDRLAEKRQAIITQAVTKGLNPAAPMKDSAINWLGRIPAHWEVKRVKHIAKLESGHTPDKKIEEYWDNGDIPWVSLNDTAELRANDYISDTKFKTNASGIANSSARLLPARAVVFTRDATIGETAITTRPMAVSQHVIAWICDQRIVLPEYLLLLIYGMTGELLRLTNGATLGTIGLGDVKELRVCVPPIPEQLQISKWVFDLKARIVRALAVVEASQKGLTEYRSAVIAAAVTGQVKGLQ